MSFSFSSFGVQGQSVEELAQESANSSFDFMPPQKNNVFVLDSITEKEAATGSIGFDLVFTCVGDKYANRKIFQYVNVIDKSRQPNQTGIRQIGALAFAMGYNGVIDNPENDLQPHLGTPFVADVDIEQDNPQYAPKNKLKNWKQNKGQPFSELPIPAKFKGEQNSGQVAPAQGFTPQNQGFEPQQSAPQQQQPTQPPFGNQQSQPVQPKTFDNMPDFARQAN